ncbi:MAG: DUF3467 domain-containing protein [Planctomycetota bacterium]|nr:DUF3467 domain-containing protein [Planctomycetota bacterium]
MSDVPNTPGNPGNSNDPGFITGELRHSAVSARVPEHVALGVFSTGAIVIAGGTEFILDFLVRMSRPHQVVARVILPHAVVPQVIHALRDNVARYTESFGAIPELPKPDTQSRPSIQEIYDDLKLPDEVLSGTYANGVMIGHTPAEFCFDFFTNFFPRSAVSCRIYLSAPQVPRLLDAVTRTYNDHQRRVAAAQAQQHQQQQQQQQQIQPQQPPPPAPPAPEPPHS